MIWLLFLFFVKKNNMNFELRETNERAMFYEKFLTL